MVACLRFDDDGRAVNRPAMTLAQEIGWHRAQIAWLRSLGNSQAAARSIEHHSQEIARLKGGEVA